jgi:hypothetical protein
MYYAILLGSLVQMSRQMILIVELSNTVMRVEGRKYCRMVGMMAVGTSFVLGDGHVWGIVRGAGSRCSGLERRSHTGRRVRPLRSGCLWAPKLEQGIQTSLQMLETH